MFVISVYECPHTVVPQLHHSGVQTGQHPWTDGVEGNACSNTHTHTHSKTYRQTADRQMADIQKKEDHTASSMYIRTQMVSLNTSAYHLRGTTISFSWGIQALQHDGVVETYCHVASVCNDSCAHGYL